MTDPHIRSELARTLRQLRKDAALTLTEVARRAGVSAATVSRLENDRYTPTPAQADALARAVRAPAVARRRVVALAQDLRERTTPRQVLLRASAAAQRKFAEIEAAAGHVKSFSPVMVLGLLQTEDYARAVFDSALPADQVEEAVHARMQRQRLITDRAAPAFTHVMTEGALRWRVTSGDLMAADLMAAQCEWIERMARAGGRLRIGIIPWSRPAGIFPLHGFDLYDERAVIVGTVTGTAYLTAPNDTAEYLRLFSALEELAVFGDDVCELLTRIAEEYRTDSARAPRQEWGP